MQSLSGRPRVAPLWGELRYSRELAQLLRRRDLLAPSSSDDPAPVMLIPGFLAADSSLRILRAWLTRRGHEVVTSGMRANVDCAERAVGRLQQRLSELSQRAGQPAFLIGHSRGGGLARCLAVRDPQATAGLVMLGTPVLDPLAISAPVRHVVSALARAGDLGLPGLFSKSCLEGDCCALARGQIEAPLAAHIRALSVYSRSDGVVDWRACLDPHAQAVEVDSSHCGMSVHAGVYELIARLLDGQPAVWRRAGASARKRARQPRSSRATAGAFS